MSGFTRHYRVKLRASLSSPGVLCLLLVSAALTLYIWPGPMGPEGPTWVHDDSPFLASMILFMWCWLWPALPAAYVKGQVAGGGLSNPGQAHPMLPVGPRSRVLAEVAVVATFTLAARVAGGFALGVETPRETFVQFFIGLSLVLPYMIFWATPSKTVEVYFLKPFTLMFVMAGAMKLGLLATLPAYLATSAILSGVALAVVGRDAHLPDSFGKRYRQKDSFFRPARDPSEQLRHDMWALPLQRYGSLLAVALVVEVGCLVLDRIVELPELTVYLFSNIFIALLLFVVGLRPFGSKLIEAGLSGMGKVAPGDFIKAWSVLPVPKESVIRLSYLHAFVTAAAAVVLVFLLVGYYGMLAEFSLVDERGNNIAALLLPLVAIIPVLAGTAICGAVGDRKRALICMTIMIFIVPVNVTTKELLRHFNQPEQLTILVVVLLGLLGGMLPLSHLRSKRAFESSV